MNTPEKYITNEILANAYARGWNHGHGIACHNVPEIGEKYRLYALGRMECDAENIREIHEALCYEAESNSRDFSPFEFTAHKFNSLGEDGEDGETTSDEAWEAFEEGVGDSIRHDLSTYEDSDYGIE
jgi:hypothetical protein